MASSPEDVQPLSSREGGLNKWSTKGGRGLPIGCKKDAELSGLAPNEPRFDIEHIARQARGEKRKKCSRALEKRS